MIKWINKKRNTKGFTLIELIVVIAILGILAAIAIPRLGGFRDTANEAQKEANERTITTAVQMYIAKAGVGPHTGADLSEFFDETSLETLTKGTITLNNVDIDADGDWIAGS